MALHLYKIQIPHWDGSTQWDEGDMVVFDERAVRSRTGRLPRGWQDLGVYSNQVVVTKKHGNH